MLNLVTVIGENTHILPHMLKHYENKVDNIYVVVYRQKDDDKILQEVEELGITPFWVVTEPKYHWQRVTDIYNTVKLKRPKDWWIVSDDDELQVYPRPIEEIIKECEKGNYTFATGGFLDRIGPDGSFPIVDKNTDLHAEFPYGGFFRYPMSGACPNKVTLMKGDQQITSGQHYALFEDGKNSWGKEHPKRLPIQESFTQVHHFKWDSTCVRRIKKVANVKQDYSYSDEYRKMYEEIRNSDWRIDINNPQFLVEKFTNFSYIDYKDYPHWNKLRDKIVLI